MGHQRGNQYRQQAESLVEDQLSSDMKNTSVFTIYGLISLVLGVLSIALGTHMLSRRAPGPKAD